MRVLGRHWSVRLALALSAVLGSVAGCHPIPVTGALRADANIAGNLNGKVEVQIPTSPDPGPMVPEIVRAGLAGPHAPRVAIIDVDGLLVNQNLTGLYSQGENPVAAFREKLEACAHDVRIRAVVLRINSSGGGVAASDVMAEEMRRFRAATNKPIVASLMDMGTGGAYYLAVGSDLIVAQPTGVTGAIGALINHVNLEDAMAQLNVRIDVIKAGENVDMGTVTSPLSDEARALLQEMADGFRDRFFSRVAQYRPGMTPTDQKAIEDGRIVPATKAVTLHMIDRLGYLDDAIAEAERLAGANGSEVILFHRAGTPVHSVYAVAPNTPLQGDLIPFSYPGLERSKLPTFLYLWQPDPTITKVPGH
jgi:protease-4